MALRVGTTDTVDQKLSTMQPTACAELVTALDNANQVFVQNFGVGGVLGHHFAVIDYKYYVFILEPASPGPDALVTYDSVGGDMFIVDFVNPKGQAMTAIRKQQLANDAAVAMSIVTPTIHIP